MPERAACISEFYLLYYNPSNVLKLTRMDKGINEVKSHVCQPKDGQKDKGILRLRLTPTFYAASLRNKIKALILTIHVVMWKYGAEHKHVSKCRHLLPSQLIWLPLRFVSFWIQFATSTSLGLLLSLHISASPLSLSLSLCLFPMSLCQSDSRSVCLSLYLYHSLYHSLYHNLYHSFYLSVWLSVSLSNTLLRLIPIHFVLNIWSVYLCVQVALWDAAQQSPCH